MELATIDTKNIPDLSTAEEEALPIGSEYWTPEDSGETKRGFILGIEMQQHDRIDEGTGEVTEVIELPCVVFAEQVDGGFRQFANGSKRLVARIEDGIKTGRIKAGETPVQIKYLGKQKNKTNQFKSDNWDVRPLHIATSA